MKYFFLIIQFTIMAATSVDTLIIEGNIHTLEKIILREIYHPIPGEFQEDLALEDKNRLYNLGIFSLIEISKSGNEYKIVLVETK